MRATRTHPRRPPVSNRVNRFLRSPWRSRTTRAVDSASLATSVALVRALAAFDAETAEHSAAVALYSRDVALQLGTDADSAAAIQLAALVHDVGKLALPAALLLKAEPLDEDEWALVREHPEAGARIVAGLPSSHTLLAVVRHHHERVDGGGYPHGLRGSEIPAAARIVGACDAYAAMTQYRPYRESLAPDGAIAELQRNADAQFDAEVVTAFVWLLDSRDDDYRLARADSFRAEQQYADLVERSEAPRHAAAS
jgi:HD-GYP domain-containing protein (c-di-GMP phosphodiesterase class II)